MMRLLVFIISLLLASPALAQDSAADRIDQLEQDVLLLKRQQERSRMEGRSAPAAPDDAKGDVGTAQVNVRISALEEDLRILRGQIEEKDFENRRLADELERFKRDMEFRIGELEKLAQAANVPATPPAPTPEAAAKPAADPKMPKKKLEVSVKDAPVPADPAAATQAPEVPKEAPTLGTADTPRDHYNYAFRLLNQNQYEDAAKSFADFCKKYPKDPLVGNAYYWQGETYYIRKDFAAAAENFRLGYEAMPKGPKAGDNLLKLGMSLAATKKNKEACIVLAQAEERFKTAASNVSAKAAAEIKRIGCE